MNQAPPIVTLVGAGPGDPDLLTLQAVKALQATSSNHPVFLGPASFKNNHFDPELVTVDQARGGTWRTVSPVLK
jgi:hypothetical protein